MNTIINTDVFYPPGACTSSSNYAFNTGAVGAGGIGYANPSSVTGYFDTTANPTGAITIESKDVIIDGRSMRDFMESMEKRMAILVPDPRKLEHFQSLQKAYAHYKTLEALCELPTDDQHA